jgi:tetratricopeptide (TPR) repeat protein
MGHGVRRGRGLLVGGATAVALALGGLLGGVLVDSPAPAGTTAAPGALAERALSGAAVGVAPSTVAVLEEAVRVRPRDPDALVQLGFAYQLRWRETADAGFLPRSEAALRRALRLRSDDPNAVLGLGSLALIRHEFRDALSLGRRAQRLLPGSARPYGIVGDALVELGRYREAFAAFERMVSLRPSLASYARIAYGRELTGDQAGAVAAMKLALDSAAGQPEPTAWSLTELARLERTRSRPVEGARAARGALLTLPGYAPARLELARAEAAQGRFVRAVAEARRAAEALPTTEALAVLADLLERVDRHAEARRQRALVAVVERLERANGVRLDLESAVFRADDRVRPWQTVALARLARATRPSIHGDDAFSWALARAGRCPEALTFAERALRLGTKDPLLFFHRGYAEGCAGNRAAMREWYRRALALSPEFSVRWAPVARAALRAP